MKHFLLAILSGCLLTLSWPTYGFSGVIFVAFVPLLLLENSLRIANCKIIKIAFLSYISFLIWNSFTTWWIWNSTAVGALFAILVNSFLMTVIFTTYHIVAKRVSLKIAFIFLVTFWISFEKFHQNWDFSWPWLNLGNVFSENITWVQWYEYTGIFGGSLWILTTNILLYISILQFINTENTKKFIFFVGRISLFILLPILFSYFKFYTHKDEGTPTEVIVLQPNIDPYSEKYFLNNQQISMLIDTLSREKITENTRFIITPETVFANNIALQNILSETQYLNRLLSQYPKINLVCGASLHNFIADKNNTTSQSNYIPERNLWINYYNAAFLLNNPKNLTFHYKSKLVVGVENMPFQALLKPLLGDLLLNLGGTVATLTTQEKPSVFFSSEKQSVAPIICYESIYGEYVSQYVREGASFLGILTNDAWWGNTQGHKQLLSYTRLRAIETRKSIARSANTGISAFINQRGEITKQLDYQNTGSLKETILVNNKQTFYTKYGDYIARISMFISIGILLSSFLRKRLSL